MDAATWRFLNELCETIRWRVQHLELTVTLVTFVQPENTVTIGGKYPAGYWLSNTWEDWLVPA